MKGDSLQKEHKVKKLIAQICCL